MPESTAPSLFAVVRNSGLFSSHWLEHRLHLEPEWKDLRDEALESLESLEKLWKLQHKRVEQYGDEQGLEHGFIQPVLEALGWKPKYQALLQGRKPDYALFLDDLSLDAALAVERDAPEFWKPATAVAEAKAWHVALDRPIQVSGKREYPPEQIEWYLDRSWLHWGILTNGKVWRLIPRSLESHQRRFQTYLEVDLQGILEEAAQGSHARLHIVEDFLHFFLFFGPLGHRSIDGRPALLERAVKGSSEYRVGVSEGLKDQTFKALGICIQGFLSWDGNGLSAERDLGQCREQAFILLCRLLFILFAEDRRLLPYTVNDLYTKNRSLSRLRQDIGSRLDRVHGGGLGAKEAEYDRKKTELWEDVQALFALIDEGGKRYGVPAYNGGLFDAELHPLLEQWKIADYHLARVVDCLGRAPDPGQDADKLFLVDHRDLAIQHLGGIYEGLLEVHPHIAKSDMVVCARTSKGVRKETVVATTEPAPEGFEKTEVFIPPGAVYLLTDKQERRNFGSYYTPDHIVDAIVRQTLGVMCWDISAQLQGEIDAVRQQLEKAKGTEKAELLAELERLQQDFAPRVLGLRVLDPSMGSGHFLLRACQYLAEEIATNPFTPADPNAAGDGEAAIVYWRRRVCENCIYGVDINPLAVELAKLALWLETVAADRPLTFLDHHLRFGNSLIGAKVENLAGLPGDKDIFSDAYSEALARKMPALLEPLAAIRDLSSEQVKDVKEKGKRFVAYEKAAEPFRVVADVWSAAATGEKINDEQYRSLVEVLDKPTTFKKVFAQDWCRSAVGKARALTQCFHWELAFPEAFFDAQGPRTRPGFDAVIGNPPYEVLSEKESGMDLSALRSFIEAEPVYAPSVRGKNNLYKLFICRALELLADGGHFGFIVPMPLLGDDQAADLRRKMVQVGRFTSIEAFPQKDKPDKRVFPEAKLSTTVFTFLKGSNGANEPFRSRVHPEREILERSPSLQLTTQSIPLYDPGNFTIVSCPQADWDLATRIMQSGRMGRLKEWAEFFQGEVNETNERAKGNLTTIASAGKLVTRGASVCLYVVRPASQGDDLYVNVASFLRDKGENTKAFHHLHRRIGLQESSPQNNFRRIIASFIPAGEYCNHTVNYCTESSAGTDVHYILGLLNSRLSDWYFRLGSTNAHVSHYQLYNLPCPHFTKTISSESKKVFDKASASLSVNRPDETLAILKPLLKEAPFSPTIRDAIVMAVKRIIAIEEARGEISRTARAALAPAAQPYQDFIDQLFYGMAGLSDKEVNGLEERYARML